MFRLCMLVALMASTLAAPAPVQEKAPAKRGLSLGYGYGGYPLPLDAYHAPLDAYHAPIVTHAPLISHAPALPAIPSLPYHAPLAYSSPYFGFGHYPYFH